MQGKLMFMLENVIKDKDCSINLVISFWFFWAKMEGESWDTFFMIIINFLKSKLPRFLIKIFLICKYLYIFMKIIYEYV
jgi:hypothetical protein